MRLFIALAIALLLYTLQSRYFKAHWQKKLQANIQFHQNVARAGDLVKMSEVITNDKGLPLPILYVKFKVAKSFDFNDFDVDTSSDYIYRNDIFTLFGHQRITRELSFTPTKRGYFTIPQIQLISKSLFLSNTLAASQDNFTELYVLPKPLTDSNVTIKLQSILGEVTMMNSFMEDPFSFRGVRDYQSYDETKHINWKASARTGDLKVNLYHASATKNIHVYLNMDPHYAVRSVDLMEYSIRLAATFVQAFSLARHTVSFHSNGTSKDMPEGISINVGSGGQHYLGIQKTLARIDTKSETSDFISMLTEIDKKRTHMEDETILLISTYRGADLIHTYNEMKHRHNIIWLCPEFASIPIKEKSPDIRKWEVDDYAEIY